MGVIIFIPYRGICGMSAKFLTQASTALEINLERCQIAENVQIL